MMTVDEYIKANGFLCPACRKPAIETAGDLDIGPKAYLDCECHACGATWTEVYQLVSFDNFEWGPVDDGEEETYFDHPSLTNGERNPGLAKGQY